MLPGSREVQASGPVKEDTVIGPKIAAVERRKARVPVTRHAGAFAKVPSVACAVSALRLPQGRQKRPGRKSGRARKAELKSAGLRRAEPKSCARRNRKSGKMREERMEFYSIRTHYECASAASAARA